MSIVINALKSIAGYLGYSTSDAPTTNADMQTYMKNQNDVLTAVVANGGLWQPSTVYSLGAVVRSPNQVAGTVAIVTTAGTSGTSEPTWTSAGNTVADGSVTYIITYGAYQIATTEEASAGTDDTKVMTPAKVAGVFAPSASPNLTGTTTAVNLTVTGELKGSLIGNADTATKATKDASGNIIDDTYATLDALKTTNDNVALKAPIESPDFTGIPTAPTADMSNNSTQVATTAYVDRASAAAAKAAADQTVANINQNLHIKGVTFPAASAAGTRILGAANDTFTAGSDTTAEVCTMSNFAPMVCYESLDKVDSNGVLQRIAVEGDYLHDQFLTEIAQGGTGEDICDAVMVNYDNPGYISRTQDTDGNETVKVADVPLDGYIPSPMHFIGAQQYKTAIGKYITSRRASDTTKACVLPGCLAYNSVTLNTYATLHAALGGYNMHACDWDYLTMLGNVKLGNRNWQTIIGKGITEWSYSYDAKCTVAETGVTRLIVSNDTAAVLEVGHVIQTYHSTADQQCVVTSIETYDSSNKIINTNAAKVFTTTTATGFLRMPFKSGQGDAILGTEGMMSGTNGKVAIKALGIENFYGNCSTQLSGFAVGPDGTVYVNTDFTKDTVVPSSIDAALAAGWVALQNKAPLANGYNKRLICETGALQWVNYPLTVGGDSANPQGDYTYYYARDVLRGRVVGGYFNYGVYAGSGCSVSFSSLLDSGNFWGARLVVKRPI